jgi:hypothetical protein
MGAPNNAVAPELGDRALVAVDGVHHPAQAALHQVVHLLLVQSLGDRGKPYGVGEQGGHGAPFPFQGGAVAEDLLGQVARRVGAGVGYCRWLRGFDKTMAAFATEPLAWLVASAAGSTGQR